jgi:uncharacterized membrane protein
MIFPRNQRSNLRANRPVIKPQMGPADWILEGLALIALISFFGVMLYQYHLLPETIPTHFNGAGQPDDFGSRDTIWILPIIAFIAWIMMTLIVRIPQTFNFPVKINERNAKVQYVLAIRLVRILKIGIILVFFYIGYATTMIARSQQGALGPWFLPILIGFIAIPIVVYLFLSLRYKQ